MTTIKDLMWDTAVTAYGIAVRMDINDIKGIDSIVDFLKENPAYSEYKEADLAMEIEDELNQIVDENLDTIRERIVGF